MNPSFLIITPVRDEEERIGATIKSMLSQTIRPTEWIIVDDGSKDRTRDIIAEQSVSHPWIKLVARQDRGFRKPGTGVMEAFHEGLGNAALKEWDFLGKLDGDLLFEANYFESCFRRFDEDSDLGIGGGVICSASSSGEIAPEVSNDPAFHVRGAVKLYRRRCWDEIGGLLRTTGWDTMDELKANMCGWSTRSFADLKVLQLKGTGTADGSWRNWFKNGRANYIVGYHPLFMAGKCVKRLGERPYGVVALALACGFVSGYLKGIQRPADRRLRAFLRREQFRALIGKDSLWRRSSRELSNPSVLAGRAP